MQYYVTLYDGCLSQLDNADEHAYLLGTCPPIDAFAPNDIFTAIYITCTIIGYATRHTAIIRSSYFALSGLRIAMLNPAFCFLIPFVYFPVSAGRGISCVGIFPVLGSLMHWLVSAVFCSLALDWDVSPGNPSFNSAIRTCM